MKKKIFSPHDKFFKKAMANKIIAEEFFRQHLPTSIQEVMDFGTLEFCKETFIDANFKTSAADVLYRTKIKERPAYFYTIAEHQSTVDELMPFRLVYYQIQIMKWHLDHVDSTTLPVVYCLVFYNGEEKYTGSMDLFDLFGEHKELAKSTFLQPYQLVDVKTIPDEELREYLWGGISQFVLKHAFTRDFSRLLNLLFSWMHHLELIAEGGSYEFLRVVIEYLINQSEGDPDLIIQAAQQHLKPKLGGEAMTAGEQLRQRGFQEGYQKAMTAGEQLRQKDLQQGLQQGFEQTRRQIALKMLNRGDNIVAISELTGLSEAEILNLKETQVA